jgi:hypothetical protein
MHHIPEGLHYLGLVEFAGAQLDGGAGVGDGLEPLRLHQRAVQVKDHRSDHRTIFLGSRVSALLRAITVSVDPICSVWVPRSRPDPGV